MTTSMISKLQRLHPPSRNPEAGLGTVTVHLTRSRDNSETLSYEMFSPYFDRAPAIIALSSGLSASLKYNGQLLRQGSLHSLGKTIRQLWNDAATNLIDTARTPHGIAIHTRDLSRLVKQPTTGLHIAAGSGPVTSWLAQPRTFVLLNHHINMKIREAPVFFCPTPTTLIAVPRSKNCPKLATWLTTFEHPLEQGGVVCSSGFPEHVDHFAA
ncbi:glycogen debranching protein [Corynebacterium silvaticum]|uniref:Glycogen debranching protein n=2 Tax=Corynebacterium silvaticum TaxID=2320431 RepID=A0A7Y4P7M0_9CORY|nr:glycogen debranching protein [Corynebacterium silvaticum]ARU46441.2 glycogen debranching protein [Corynebacterium silvaticum]